MNHFYFKVNIGESADFSSDFRISSIFTENHLELTVLKEGAAYNLEVTKDCLIPLAKNQGMNLTDYFSGLKNYFEMRPDKIQFVLKDGKFSINVLLENKMRKIYFQATLNSVNYDQTVLGMLDNLYNDKITYFKDLKEEQTSNTKVKTDYAILDRKLTELAESRKTEELDLYNKFLKILNEKKRHIQHLNDLLQAFRQGRPTINPPVIEKQKKSRQKSKEPKTEPPDNSPNESDYEIESDDENYTTDEEKNTERTSNKSPTPGTSKDNFGDVDMQEIDKKPFAFPRRINSETNLNVEMLSLKQEPQPNEPQNGELKAKRPKIEKKASVVDYDTQELLNDLD